MAASDLPETAVSAAAAALYDEDSGENPYEMTEHIEDADYETQRAYRATARAALAAAAPHIRADERARVLDEVQAALRDEDAFGRWERAQDPVTFRFYVPQGDRRTLADYLRDTLGAVA